MRHGSRLLAGIVTMLIVTVGYLFASGSATSLNDVITAFAMTIVCTLGIGLALWLGVAYFVGWIVLVMFDAIRSEAGASGPSIGRASRHAARDSAAKSPPVSSRATAALRPSRQRSLAAVGLFLERSRAAGQDMDQAVAKLRAAGWSDDDIATARQAVGL